MVQAPNDKQQIEPMLERIGTLPEEAGDVAGGGVMPSRPTLTRLASSVPSSFLTAPKMMTLAPAFSSDLSPGDEGDDRRTGRHHDFLFTILVLDQNVLPVGALDCLRDGGVGHGRVRTLVPGPETLGRATLVLGEYVDLHHPATGDLGRWR